MKEAGLTQEEVAKQLGKPQSYISKTFSGERRMDLVEIRAFCEVVGEPLVRFVGRYEDMLAESPPDTD